MRNLLLLAGALVTTACSAPAPSLFGEDTSDAGVVKDPSFGDAALPQGYDAGPTSCAKAAATPTPVPVSLVFIFDKSGSMNDNSKWPSCETGLTSFFGDPASKGLSASLQFFPDDFNECSSSVYAAPAVPMRALPDGATFASTMSAIFPNGGTPTLPALAGSLAYATGVQAKTPAGKTAIVLVTDGQPNDCSSSVSAVASEAQTAFKAGFPVFVIGVGDTGNLNAIAAAGGTTKATIVDTSNATQTAKDFQTALEAIRGLTLACEYQIPPLPDGSTIDQVNVVFTPTGGSPVTLDYDANCTMGGWHYDDPSAPKKIELCKSECDTVQADKSGKIDLVFGCATQGGIPH